MVTCRGGAAEARLGIPPLRLLWKVTFSSSLANDACVNEVDNEVNSELGVNRGRRPRSDDIEAWC
jgi:hypothetical protein